MTVSCDYCGKPAELVSSATVYQGREYGPIWFCPDCNAWVGTHKGTDRPLGRLANAELQQMKRKAHASFDPLWRGKSAFTRKAAYEWLAEQMGLPKEQTHIGMFDVDQCRKVIRICREAKRHEQTQL